MIVIISCLIGIFIGTRTAKSRGGQRLDLLQYAAGYGIAFALLGFLITMIVERLLF